MNMWRQIVRYLLVAIFVMIAIGAAAMLLPRYQGLVALRRQKATLEAENRRLEAATRRLRHQQERFNMEPEFVERTAREAEYVRTNELVFKFVPVGVRDRAGDADALAESAP